jgi:hypothetical protein
MLSFRNFRYSGNIRNPGVVKHLFPLTPHRFAVALSEGETLSRRRLRYGLRYAGGFCPAEFMLMQISAQGFAVASVASEAMPDGRGGIYHML